MMADYIDREKVMAEINRTGGHNLSEWNTIGVKALIDRQITEDVVPRSEVEELKAENESLAKTVNKASELIRKLRSENNRLKAYDEERDVQLHQRLVRETKQEVAMEIFEELECNFHDDDFGDLTIDFMEYLELKKKYIGE